MIFQSIVKLKVFKPVLSVSFILSTLFYTGCYYDVAEVLYPTVACNTDAVTYSQTITSIMVNNCYACHSADANQGDIIVEGYDKLKILVDNGKLLGSIKHESGYIAMPQDASPLVACDIAKIEKWVADGAPNN